MAVINTNLLEDSVVCVGSWAYPGKNTGFQHCYSMVLSASGVRGERPSEQGVSPMISCVPGELFWPVLPPHKLSMHSAKLITIVAAPFAYSCSRG